MEKICVDPKSKKALVAKYGAHAVSRALNFKVNSLVAKEIRHEAMNTYQGYILKF